MRGAPLAIRPDRQALVGWKADAPLRKSMAWIPGSEDSVLGTVDLEMWAQNMTMASIDLGNDRRLEVEPGRPLIWLYPAVAGAHLELGVRAIATGQHLDSQVMLAATVYVADAGRRSRRMLCRVQATHHVIAPARGAEVRLTGMIRDEQLRAIEELRAGGDLWLCLAFEIGVLLGDPPSPAIRPGQLDIPVSAGEWTRQVENVDASTLIELFVPMPHDSDEPAEAQRRIGDDLNDQAAEQGFRRVTRKPRGSWITTGLSHTR